MSGERRPYRVVFEEDQRDGTTRRGTVIASDLDQARMEAQAITRDGRRAEVHYVADDGERARLEVYLPYQASDETAGVQTSAFNYGVSHRTGSVMPPGLA